MLIMNKNVDNDIGKDSPIDLVYYRLTTDVFQGFIDSDKQQVFSSTKLSRVTSRVTIILAFTSLRKHKEEPITMILFASFKDT